MEKPGVPLMIYFNLCLVLSFIPRWLLPSWNILPAVFTSIGTAIAGVGLILNLWPWLQFNQKKILDEKNQPVELVTTGFYAFSRHPMYLGLLMVLLGVACWTQNPLAFIAFLIFFFICHQAYIPAEEQNLRRIFGAQYDDYAKKVRQWL